MSWARARAKEVVRRDAQRGVQRLKRSGMFRNPPSGRDSGAFGREYVLKAVVVRPGDETDAPPTASAVSRKRIGDAQFQCEPEVRIRIHVRDRGGEVRRLRYERHGRLLG